MKKGTIFLIALTCLTLMSAQSVSAQSHIRAYVNKPVVEVQNKPSGFVLGSLFENEAFTIICKSKLGDWAYGNAHGRVRRTGWVLLDHLHRPTEPKPCSSSHVIKLKQFMHATNGVYNKNSRTCRKDINGALFSGESKCDGSLTAVLSGTPYYRNFNFRTGRPRHQDHPDRILSNADDVYWRYVTKHIPDRGDYVALRLSGHHMWGFVLKGFIVSRDFNEPLPKYDNCQYPRAESCCMDNPNLPGCTMSKRPELPVTPRVKTLAGRFRNHLSPTALTAMYAYDNYWSNNWKRNAELVGYQDDDNVAELSVTEDASDDPVVTGSNITYTITVLNNGDSAASPFSVSADLPAQTSFVSCSATGGGVCGGTGNNRTVTFGSLAPDEWVTVTLTATVNCPTADGTVITSTATLSCSSASECSPPDENTADEDEDTEGNNEDFRETVFTTVSDPGPSITAPPAVTAFTGPNATACGAVVSDATLGAATANDNCAGVTITRTNVPAGNFFPVGQTVITYTATDLAGHTATDTQLVTVIDNTPPVISQASVDKQSLWPPDHKMANVTVNYVATDNCGFVTNVLRVTSNEAVNGLGDGDASPDWEVVDAHHVRLRAERSGQGIGRVYTITIISTDGAGNSSSKQVFVAVPRDQRR